MRSNLVPACSQCNAAKGSAKDWQAWYQKQSFFCINRASRIESWLKPRIMEDLDLWRIVQGENNERLNTRTKFYYQQALDRDSFIQQGGVDSGIIRMLGGSVQAEVSLSG